MELKPEDLVIEPWRSRGIRITHTPTSAMVMCDTEDNINRNRGLALEMLHAKLKNIVAHRPEGAVQLWLNHETGLLTESTTGRGTWYIPYSPKG